MRFPPGPLRSPQLRVEKLGLQASPWPCQWPDAKEMFSAPFWSLARSAGARASRIVCAQSASSATWARIACTHARVAK